MNKEIESHLIGVLQTRKSFDRVQEVAQEELEQAEAAFEKATDDFCALCPNTNLAAWIAAEKNVFTASLELMDAMHDLEKCKAALEVCRTRENTVRSVLAMHE